MFVKLLVITQFLFNNIRSHIFISVYYEFSPWQNISELLVDYCEIDTYGSKSINVYFSCNLDRYPNIYHFNIHFIEYEKR